MSEKREAGVNRRTFIKGLGVATLAALGIYSLEKARDNRLDIFNAESAPEFFARGKEFYLGRLNGQSRVMEGATIHDRPTYEYSRDPSWPFTTSPDPRTDISIVGRDLDFTVNNPVLVLAPAQSEDSGQNVKEITITGDSGEEAVKIYTPASWIIFTTDMAEGMDNEIRKDIESRSQYEMDGKKVACVNFSNTLFRLNDQEEFLREFPVDGVDSLYKLDFSS
jgi:hypothetical protein